MQFVSALHRPDCGETVSQTDPSAYNEELFSITYLQSCKSLFMWVKKIVLGMTILQNDRKVWY